ncbi:MAG: ribosome biogenesis GTP-binding protein YihA/YsxC [Betaproteobacteria bacterium]|nr:ribosome biogenesis GTP-binding protein YihA/YsxC [Betaproteobacteria bacterium]
MSLFRNATFYTTVAQLSDLPVDARCEIAFVGRSNAGKSSAINTLAGRARLAFVSKTPGRTQHLNFFTLAPHCYLVDLPGYGYAKAPEEVRNSWKWLLAPYLKHRPQLAGIVLIMDSRHPLTELDVQMLEWFALTGKRIHILLSKADKLSRQAQGTALRKVKAALVEFGEQCSVQLFSSLKKTGIDEAEAALSTWFDPQQFSAEEAP